LVQKQKIFSNTSGFFILFGDHRRIYGKITFIKEKKGGKMKKFEIKIDSDEFRKRFYELVYFPKK
jgi:hypothetical protein